MRTSSAGTFVLGVLVGAVGLYLAQRLKEAVEEGDIEELAERIQDSLGELESRIQDILPSSSA